MNGKECTFSFPIALAASLETDAMARVPTAIPDCKPATYGGEAEEETLGPCGDTISGLDCLPPEEVRC